MKYLENLTGRIRSYKETARFYRALFPAGRLAGAAAELVLRGRLSFPVTIDILVTRRCALFCWMCAWKVSGSGPAGEEDTELGTEEITDLVKSVSGRRPVIHFGGGEPFLRPDIVRLVSSVKENGMRCMMTTSGYPVKEEALKGALDAGIDALIFSLYGWGGTHDDTTGVKGSFDRTLESVRSALALRKRGTRVFVSTLPLPDNTLSMVEFTENIRKLGVDGVKVEHLNFVTREEYRSALANEGAQGLAPFTFISDGYFDPVFAENVVKTCRELKKRFGGYVLVKPYLSEPETRAWYTGPFQRYYRCFFIRHSALVNYNGDILPCHFFPGRALGNIRRAGLDKIWNSAACGDSRRAIAAALPAVCGRCCKN